MRWNDMRWNGTKVEIQYLSVYGYDDGDYCDCDCDCDLSELSLIHVYFCVFHLMLTSTLLQHYLISQ